MTASPCKMRTLPRQLSHTRLIGIRVETLRGHNNFGNLNLFFYIYVTVNMCNQGIRVFTENFREYAYSLKWSGNMRIP